MTKKIKRLPKRVDQAPDDAVMQYAAAEREKARKKAARPAAAPKPAAGPAAGPARPAVPAAAPPAAPAAGAPAPAPGSEVHTTKRIEKTLARYREVNKARIRKAEEQDLPKEVPDGEDQDRGRGPGDEGRSGAAPQRAGGLDGRTQSRRGFIFPFDWFGKR